MRAFLLALAAGSSTPAFGTEPLVVCAPGDPTACVAPLRLGDRAPFAGQLLTPAKAIQLGQAAAHCDERVAIEVAHTSSIARVQRDFDRALAAAAATQAASTRQALEVDRDYWKGEAGRRVEPSPWYTSPYVVVPATVVVTLLAVAGAVEIVKLSAGAP